MQTYAVLRVGQEIICDTLNIDYSDYEHADEIMEQIEAEEEVRS